VASFLIAYQGGFNMDTLPIGAAAGVISTTATATGYGLSLTSTLVFSAFGQNFAYDSAGRLVGGTITSFFVIDRMPASFPATSVPYRFVVDIEGLSTPATALATSIAAADPLVIFAALLAGDDYVGGAPGHDLLRGFDGDDRMDGVGGCDSLFGGAGNDTIVGGAGVLFDPRANYLRGEAGDDSIVGRTRFFDDIHGNQGNDTCAGGNGGDWVVGGQGNDVLYGDSVRSVEEDNLLGIIPSPGDDIVLGNLGDDTCGGGGGDDVVRGGQGADSVSGGEGSDFVSGDRGDDTVAGGAGADRFHGFSGCGLDRILDFKAAEGDRIELLAGTIYTVHQEGADTVIDMGGADRLVLVGVSASSLPPGAILLG
jgi:serralysin